MRTKSALVIAATVSILLAGCSTPYQPRGMAGGYSEIQIDPTTVRVSFKGNGYTDRSVVESYLLYRAAEVCLNRGFDWFIVTEREGEGEWHPSYGNTGFTSTAVIKMYVGAKPESLARSYDARLTLHTMAGTIKK
jgi:hypothetical protein